MRIIILSCILILVASCGGVYDAADVQTWLAVGQSNMRKGVVQLAFAEAMKVEGVEVEVIETAIGSTDIQCWRRGGECWSLLIKPLIGAVQIDGILYWQGETEARGDNGEAWKIYDQDFIALINEYRSDFGNIPFIFVILQNYDEDKSTYKIDEPECWRVCREKQLKALKLDNVYGVETRDITDGSIHPVGAYELIGERAAAIALDILN